MGRKGLLVCAVHLSFASSFVLNPPQSLPEISTTSPIAVDTSSNTSAIHIAPIPSTNSDPGKSDPTSSLSLANITALADNATLTNVAVSCNGVPFPTPGPASYASCQDAFDLIRSGSNVITYGDRASGNFDADLPIRFMSGERTPSPQRSPHDLAKGKCWS